MNEPNYCPYHRHLGHTIEDGNPFKEWLEKAIQNKVFALSPGCQQDSPVQTANVITMDAATSTTEDWEGDDGRKQGADSLSGTDSDTDSDIDKGWITVSRKKPTKSTDVPFSRAISEVPKADHYSSVAPALIHKKKKVSKKKPRKTTPAQPLKQTAGKVMTYEEYLQYMEEYYKWLEEFEEYEQGEPHEVVLDDFMPKGWRQKEPCSVNQEEEELFWEQPVQVAPCRVVSVYPRQSVARTLLRSPSGSPSYTFLLNRDLHLQYSACHITTYEGASSELDTAVHDKGDSDDEPLLFANEAAMLIEEPNQHGKIPDQLSKPVKQEVDEMKLRDGKRLPEPHQKKDKGKAI